MSFRVIVIAIALCAHAVPAQDWTRLSPTQSPSPRSSAAATFDPCRGQGLMFGGGSTAIPPLDETWTWDGATWTQHSPAIAPRGRRLAGLAMDTLRCRAVLFGGQPFPLVNLTDTWEWDGSAWIRVATVGPPSRFAHAMAFDPARGVVVLFGGRGSRTLDDTWEWDGTQWSEVITATTPTARSGQTMAYDADLGGVVMIGGSDNPFGGPYFDDSWVFDGIDWRELRSPRRPTALYLAAIAHDGQGRQNIRFGGQFDGLTNRSSDATWQLRDGQWFELFPTHAPPARFGHVAFYDEVRDRVIVFGGVTMFSGGTFLDDTWEFGGVTASYALYGAPSCSGAHGAPQLTPRNAPAIGSTIALDIAPVPPGASVEVLVGYRPTALPLDVIGVFGCQLLVPLPVVTQHIVANASGTATWSFPIRSDPTLAGTTVFGQAVVHDTAAPNAIGILMSDAVRYVVN